MSQSVEIDHVSMQFGDFTAVRDVSLTIGQGEFFSFLGPSGCGKTTLLRLISGFIEPSSGVIRIGGRDMRGISANQRPTAMIFQNLALFPLMTVAENIAFGLEVRGVAKAARHKRAEELLELIALPGQGNKQVSELSGGQRQRVAIARALAVEPSVLLLDEPLSALDLKLRQHMRNELRAIQRRTGVTFIYITHDQGEALTMSDRVGVMSQGVLQQVATPEQLYAEPATPFVATFVGENNRLHGVVHSVDGERVWLDTPQGRLCGYTRQTLQPQQSASLFIRPERLQLATDASSNRITAQLSHRHFEGAFVHLVARTHADLALTMQWPNTGLWPVLNDGQTLELGFSAHDALVLAEAGS